MVQTKGRDDGRRRVAIYCRVSTGGQDNDRQERDLIEYAERADFEVVEIFRETLSGIRKSKGKQPVERKRVTELAQRRGIDAVLVTEMTRWGRSTQDLMDTLGQLASWDVSLIAPDGVDVRPLDAPGQADRQPDGLPGRVRARSPQRARALWSSSGQGPGSGFRTPSGIPSVR